MRILSINLGNYGSTGMIMKNVGITAKNAGHEVVMAYPENPRNNPKEKDDIIICSDLERKISERVAYEIGYRGVQSWISTFCFLRKVKQFSPDIIHLHNLHNCYINLPLLFGYIKKYKVRTIWTLHDCWSFTGQCPHFTMIKCDKWKAGCYECPSFHEYPRSKVDKTKTMWELKKKWFAGVEDLTLVTPSQWLAELVKESFLKDYPIKVVHNGIDCSVFEPTESDFRFRYGVSKDKFVILGVAFDWGVKKGLDVFIKLYERLDKQKFQIVLVGTDDKVDKELPEGIISIHRTKNQRELAEIYTASDLFVNPTREDTFPTVNLEALACGIPVITFNTGGCVECINRTCGSFVECNDVDAMEEKIIRIYENNPYIKDDCIIQAKEFTKEKSYYKYLSIYDECNVK